MTSDYKEEVLGFQRHLDLHNAILMPINEDEIGICKELSRMHIDKYRGEPFDLSKVRSIFLGNISILGSKTKDYYEKRLPKIKIVKTSYLKNGYAEIYGFPGTQQIYVTNRPFTSLDFVAVSHELGHVPTIDNPVKSGKEYFEYIEVLSMYFEYIACQTLDQKRAKEILLKIRLEALKSEAMLYLDAAKKIKNNNSYADKMYECRKRDSYKYMKSLEFLLQLIEIAEKDQNKVNNLLDEIVLGNKSFREIEQELNINTNSCKKILSII